MVNMALSLNGAGEAGYSLTEYLCAAIPNPAKSDTESSVRCRSGHDKA